VPLHFAGVDFHPGHFLYADQDGVVVSQHDLLNPQRR
jgi:regulator of RNase E activity RraA